MAVLPAPKYTRFDLDAAWDKHFLPLLSDPRVQAAVHFAMDEIIYHLDKSETTVEESVKIKAELKEMKTREDRYAVLGKYSLGRFIGSGTEHRARMCKEASSGRHDLPTTIGYYRYYDHQSTIILLWALCRLAWPTKTWLIVCGNIYDDAVICQEEPTMIYTFDPDHYDLSRFEVVSSYTNPVQYQLHFLTSLTTVPVSLYSLTMYASKYMLPDEEEYDEFMGFEVPRLLRLQEAYAWASR